MTLFHSLPNEVLLEVFTFLDVRVLFTSVMGVCKLWRDVSAHCPVTIDFSALMTLGTHPITVLDTEAKKQKLQKIANLLLPRFPRAKKVLTMNSFYQLFTDSHLHVLATSCRYLEHIHLVCSSICGSGFLSLAKFCPNLKKLEIYECNVNDEGVSCLLPKSWKSLRILKFFDTSGSLSSDGFATLIRATHNLKALDIGDENGNFRLNEIVIDSAVENIARYLPELEYLCLCSCDISDGALSALARSCNSLRYLDLSETRMNNSYSTGSIFLDLCVRCPLIEALNVGWANIGSGMSPVTDDYMEAIGRLQSLKQLDIGDASEVTDKGLGHVAKGCKQLQLLDLYNCPKVTPKGIMSITKACVDISEINSEMCDHSLGQDAHAMAIKLVAIRPALERFLLGPLGSEYYDADWEQWERGFEEIIFNE